MVGVVLTAGLLERMLARSLEVTESPFRILLIDGRAVRCGLLSLLGRSCADPPSDHRALPRVKEAWVRKGASVVFPWDEEKWPDAPEIAIVEVGGEDCEDQRARLRFLAEAIREKDRGATAPRPLA